MEKMHPIYTEMTEEKANKMLSEMDKYLKRACKKERKTLGMSKEELQATFGGIKA